MSQPRSRRWNRLQRSAAAFGGLAVAVGLIAAAAAIALQSDCGRAAIARQVERVLSEEIRGSMTVGSLDAVTAEGLVATNVRFEDESGRLVLVADQVELAVDWRELMGGHFVSRRGHVRGGRVVLETLPTGGLRLARAFASAHPGPPDQPTGPDIVRLETLSVSSIVLSLQVPDAPAVNVTRITGVVVVRAPENRSVVLRVHRLGAVVHVDSPSPIDLRVEDGSLALDGDSQRRAQLTLPSQVGGTTMLITAVIRMNAANVARVDLHIAPRDHGAALLNLPLLVQAWAAEGLSDSLAVTVDLP